MGRIRKLLERYDQVVTALLVALVVAVAGHQFMASAGGVLSPWKGGGFGMYTAPHGIGHRAVFLVVDGHSLRMTPDDRGFTDWIKSVDPASAKYLNNMIKVATDMVTYPDDAAADRLMSMASHVVWDKVLFDVETEVGRHPANAMAVTVIEVAFRPSKGVIDSRIVFSKTGE